MPVPEVQSRVHGERIQVHGETGKGINCGTVPTVEQSSPTNKVYYFGSKNVGSHSAHERNLSPKIQEVAHRIITFGTGPISRKRQRLDSRMEDPFDLDRFIGGAPGLATQKNISGNTIPVGESSRFHPLPDLNSQIIRPPQDEQGNSDQVGGGGRNWIGGGRSAEVDATINMGKELGANLINLEELETQLENIDKIPFEKMWGGRDYGAFGVKSVGRSGGLCCCWNKDLFKVNFSKSGSNFILLNGVWKGINSEINLVNVYGPQDNGSKKDLWAELLSLKQNSGGLWIMMGDFNAIRWSGERTTLNQRDPSMKEFNEFISDANLLEYSMGGAKYTWMRKDGSVSSKLDRFLVCDSFVCLWPLASVTALDSKWSDHKPIILSCFNLDYGPTPFRLFNSWLGHGELPMLVYNSWASKSVKGRPDYVLSKKLTILKNEIRAWCIKKKMELEQDEAEIEKQIITLEKKVENMGLSEPEKDKMILMKKKRVEMENKKKLDLKQRARIKWLVDGDENSAFFHGVINGKKRRNRINGLMINNKWVIDPKLVKKEVLMQFKKKFSDDYPIRPSLINDNLGTLSDSHRVLLEADFSEEEIKHAIWQCAGGKAPGPDGFSFEFIRKFWNVFKTKFLGFFKCFEKRKSIAKGCNSSFFTLAPKGADPESLGDFRPISLIGTMAKSLGKLLALRLQQVVSSVVGNEQTAFIKGRNIFDGHILVNSIHGWAKKSSTKLMLFKVDFAKAFDSLNWNFLDSIMLQMGFGARWRSWIKGYLKSGRASVLVNGSPTDEFPMERGVRQGDPISPFLFILAMEGLSAMMRSASQKGLFKGVRLPNSGPTVTHSMYADDVFFIGEWDKENVSNLKRILRCFYIISGLKINYNKSKLIGVGASDQECNEFASIMGCMKDTLPIQHLGMPIGANMRLAKNWDPVVLKVKERLNSWKAKTLSFGGRLTLVKAVLGSLPLYFLSMFKAPVKILKELEVTRRRFLWGGNNAKKKIHWVKWDNIIKPRRLGGLGVGGLHTMNHALLTKWKWKVLNDPGSLWARCIKAIHKSPLEYPSDLHKKSISDNWSAIVTVGKDLGSIEESINNLFRKHIGNGAISSFWNLAWFGTIPFRRLFPALFVLDRNKKCRIADRVHCTSSGSVTFNWDWKKGADAHIRAEEIGDIENMIKNYGFIEGPDKWVWEGNPSGNFTTESCRRWLEDNTMKESKVEVLWLGWVPLTVRCFMWRLLQHRLPMASALKNRGVSIVTDRCPLCLLEVETEDHTFIRCPVAKNIWCRISKWMRIDVTRQVAIQDLAVLIRDAQGTNKIKKIRTLITYCTYWLIWKARNKWIFSQVRSSVENMVDEVKVLSFSWLETRGKKLHCSWEEWLVNPITGIG
ncbi:hypothetical protein L1987_08792 [Smallanthus sonchifolius]|uniref:Uncharacterized protein n=1 Tax=Smallanthus sonchifolius TaxID=185202 RepID=A0ACB9JNC6_9ASTR|nr:hypothetical protein L1987_08792 [Smallanthus sonchifolius]